MLRTYKLKMKKSINDRCVHTRDMSKEPMSRISKKFCLILRRGQRVGILMVVRYLEEKFFSAEHVFLSEQSLELW